MTSFLIDNIEELTLNNDNYRKVINTTKTQQLVVMNIPNKEEIGMEKHSETTQFIRIEKGIGIAIVNDKEYKLKKGDFVMIPPNTYHNIISTSKNGLKLYTIYSPPVHKKNLVQEFKK